MKGTLFSRLMDDADASLVGRVGLPVVSANFLFAAGGDDAVSNAIDASPCATCGLVHVWSRAGSYRMEPTEWVEYRRKCGREAAAVGAELRKMVADTETMALFGSGVEA